MSIRTIAPIGEPILRQPARSIDRAELASAETQTFIDDLVATMRHAKGAGLAATQIFDDRRICAIEVGDNPRYPYKPKIPLTILVNPTVTAISEETFANYEGCLSVPNLRGLVHRSVGVKVEAWDRHGEPIEEEIWGLSAGTYQHEVDHLDGVLFVDRVEDPKTYCTWESFERHHRAPFVARVEALVKRFGS